MSNNIPTDVMNITYRYLSNPIADLIRNHYESMALTISDDYPFYKHMLMGGTHYCETCGEYMVAKCCGRNNDDNENFIFYEELNYVAGRGATFFVC